MEVNRQIWNEQQRDLRQTLARPIENTKVIALFLSLHAKVHSAVMSGSDLWSFVDEIWLGLDEQVIRQIPRGGEHSIAWIYWHMSRIEDVTMNMLLAGRPQLLYQDGWFERLSVPYNDTGNAMKEVDIRALSDGINIDALSKYRIAIGRNTQEVVRDLHVLTLSKKVEPARLRHVADEGAVVEEAYGLLNYWGGLTYGGLLLMPPTRHNFIHLNEALRVKQKIQTLKKKGK